MIVKSFIHFPQKNGGKRTFRWIIISQSCIIFFGCVEFFFQNESDKRQASSVVKLYYHIQTLDIFVGIMKKKEYIDEE